MPARKQPIRPLLMRQFSIPGYIPRVIVKFKDNQAPPFEDGALDRDSRWLELRRQFPGIQLKKLLTSLPPAGIRDLIAQAQRENPAYRPPNFFAFFRIDCALPVDVMALAGAVSEWLDVQMAYYDPPGNEPGVNLAGDEKAKEQGYLNPANPNENKKGIDAHYAWTVSGGDGAKQNFLDFERGWGVTHSDLGEQFLQYSNGEKQLFGVNLEVAKVHGTNVLGVVCARDSASTTPQGYCLGITPNLASVDLVSYWGAENSRANALLHASKVLAKGGVLLIEAQLNMNPKSDAPTCKKNPKLLPIEVGIDSFAMIELAVNLGIVVVEAAGNGKLDFDSSGLINPYTPETLGEKSSLAALKRKETAIFKDSGAIMVAAAASGKMKKPKPQSLKCFSNYGSRIDCFAWGDEVVTLTYPSGTTESFNGTSSAAAIIAGAALATQGVIEHKFEFRLNSRQMRALLSYKVAGLTFDEQTTSPSSELTGVVMPNLKNIINKVIGMTKQQFLSAMEGL